MTRRNIKLSRATASRLITEIIGVRVKLEKAEGAPSNVAIYTAVTGTLEIKCENDWYDFNGRIRLTISDGAGGNHIHMYFHPDTLNRDFLAEEAEKEDKRLKERKDWVGSMGKEMAHRLVDQYWEG